MTVRWSDTINRADGVNAEARMEEMARGMATEVQIPDPPSNWFNWGAWRTWLINLAQAFGSALVPLAEKLLGANNGTQKKELVLLGLEKLYDELEIDIPWVPRGVEIMVLRLVAGNVIDMIVKQFNAEGVFAAVPDEDPVA